MHLTTKRWIASICTLAPAIAALFGCALPPAAPNKTGLARIEHVVVIYAENRSFDNLYGLFPGANGIANATPAQYTQVDNDGKPFATLPPVWKGRAADAAFPSGMPNRPFRIDQPPVNLPLSIATRDLVHKFYQNQEQIDGGRVDRYVAASDAGSLAMGYYDGSTLPLWKWARDYTLADNFFMGAFGGSYLNHFWLICACTPVDRDAAPALRAQLDERGFLQRKPDSPPSAAAGPPAFVRDGDVTPDGWSVNTTQPPYQPSRVPPARGGDARFTDPAQHALPPQTQKTIGDTLTDKGISWAWYAGAWDAAIEDGMQDAQTKRRVIATRENGAPYFVTHHQPFNYFSRFAPGTADRALHIKDYKDLAAGIAQGKLPQVAFYKPEGVLNEHPGYADVLSGDEHIAAVIAAIKASPLWDTTAIIVTYDENGGFWDPPAIDGDRARGYQRSSFRRTRAAATSTTRVMTRRRSSNSSRVASASTRCRAFARRWAT